MSVGAIGGNASNLTGVNRFGELDTGEFINVLITELQNQDPFNPQDTTALLEQLSSIRNIESQLGLQNKLDELVLQNQVATAGNMIGNLVEGNDTKGEWSEGLVMSVRVADGEVTLELDTGQSMNMSDVVKIVDTRTSTERDGRVSVADMVGKLVEAVDGYGAPVSGVVQSADVTQNGGVVLTLNDGTQVAGNSVTMVHDLSDAAATAGGMISRYVTGEDVDGQTARGKVIQVSVSADAVELVLDNGKRMSVSSVRTIDDAF
jgi:flagellar basal-body rod modification protein FlgD